MRKNKRLIIIPLLMAIILSGCSENKKPIEPVEDVKTQEELVLPEINAGEIRNDSLSSDADKENEIIDNIVNIENDNDLVISTSKRYIYNGGTWYYNQLNEREKLAYIKIKTALENAGGKKEEILDFENISKIELTRAYRSAIDDNPQIFVQNNGDGEIVPLKDANGKEIGYTFKMVYDSYWNEINLEMAHVETEKEIQKIMQKMDMIEGDYYKILWLYNYLIKDIDYVDELPWSASIYGALVKKECSCEAISEAFEYILNLYNIETIGVTGISGFATNEGGDYGLHKWNMVKLDGDWYHFDVTWDIKKDLSKFLPYTYFAVDTKTISFSHLPFFEDLTPKATATKYNYYYYNDLIVHKYSDEELIRVGKKCYSLTPGYFSFKFENQDDFIKALQNQELNQWIPKVIQANKLTKWQYLISYNPDLQIIEFAIFDTVQY